MNVVAWIGLVLIVAGCLNAAIVKSGPRHGIKFLVLGLMLLFAGTASAQDVPSPTPAEPSGEDMLLAAAIIRFVHQECGAAGLTPLHYMTAGLVEKAAPPGLAEAAYDRTVERIEANFEDHTAACASLVTVLSQRPSTAP